MIKKLFVYIKYFFFTLGSNISPNKNIKYYIFILLKSSFTNIKYSYKNIFNPLNDIKFEFSKGSYWDRCVNHLNFVGKYFNTSQIHNAVVLQMTVHALATKSNKNLTDKYFTNNNLNNYSNFLSNIFENINDKKMLFWYGSFYHTFVSDVLSLDQKRCTENSHVLEIGPGLGLNSLIYSDFNSKEIYYFDLSSMILIQKNIEQKIKTLKKINEIIYNDDATILEKSLSTKDFYIISRYAFSEFPLNIRSKFEKLIKMSKFSLFLSNEIFENVDNKKYFKDLTNKIGKKLLIKDYYYPEQDRFTKKHKYFIIYD